MDEIIVIRAADPDGSIFKAIVNALKDKRTEAVHVADTVSSVLRVGELEIHHEYRWVMMAGREVRLNHGEYDMATQKRTGGRSSASNLYKTVTGSGYKHRCGVDLIN